MDRVVGMGDFEWMPLGLWYMIRCHDITRRSAGRYGWRRGIVLEFGFGVYIGGGTAMLEVLVGIAWFMERIACDFLQN